MKLFFMVINLSIKAISVNYKYKKDKITTGPVVEAEKIKYYLKSKYSLVCNSGTSAIFSSKVYRNKKGDVIAFINFIASYNVSKFFNAKVYLSMY